MKPPFHFNPTENSSFPRSGADDEDDDLGASEFSHWWGSDHWGSLKINYEAENVLSSLTHSDMVDLLHFTWTEKISRVNCRLQ